MATNCVNYSNSTNATNKFRTKLGNPNLNTYPNIKTIIYVPDCITCNKVIYNNVGLQCKACILRHK